MSGRQPPSIPVLEVGGTHVTAAIVDTIGWQLRECARLPLDSQGPAEAIVATLAAATRSLTADGTARWAVAIPDPFDYAHGVALFRGVGKFDHLYGVDLGRALRSAIAPRPASITFVHDAEAFLLGEWTSGAAAGQARAMIVTLGTGIGSAFLADGHLVTDAAGLPPGGRIHRLQVNGAPLEHTVSRRAIRARYVAEGGDGSPDVREIAERARGGEPTAKAVFAGAVRVLGRALAPSVAGFVPDVIVVGGSMSGSWDLIEKPLRTGLADEGITAQLVRPAAHPDDAPIVGAARYVADALAQPASSS